MALLDLADVAAEWKGLPTPMKIAVIGGAGVVAFLAIAAYQKNKASGSSGSSSTASGYPGNTAVPNSSESSGAWTVSGGTTNPSPVASVGSTGTPPPAPVVNPPVLKTKPPVPVKTPPSKSMPLKPLSTYTVRPGDTLSGIAARNHLTLSQIIARNPGITNPNLIYPQQKVNL